LVAAALRDASLAKILQAVDEARKRSGQELPVASDEKRWPNAIGRG
jgi:hypothetical protein